MRRGPEGRKARACKQSRTERRARWSPGWRRRSGLPPAERPADQQRCRTRKGNNVRADPFQDEVSHNGNEHQQPQDLIESHWPCSCFALVVQLTSPDTPWQMLRGGTPYELVAMLAPRAARGAGASHPSGGARWEFTRTVSQSAAGSRVAASSVVSAHCGDHRGDRDPISCKQSDSVSMAADLRGTVSTSTGR